MKRVRNLTCAGTILLVVGLLVCNAAAGMANASDDSISPRQTVSFDNDWLFLKSDADGAQQSDFADKDWRKLDLPHDWSIEGPFSETNKTGGAGGFLPAGIGWYRKHFTLPASDAGRRVFIEFDGVMANRDAWVNGHHLGHRPNGYVSFSYDLTGHLVFGEGKTNVLAVRADNSQQPASRWYAGAGIYRHVRLVVTDPVHLEAWSTFASTPKIGTNLATVRVYCAVTNETGSPRDILIDVSILDPRGTSVATSKTPAHSVTNILARSYVEVDVRNPQLWDLTSPNLYRAVVGVRSGDTVLDDETVAFGIRRFEFKSDSGFWLNGKNFKLYGVCLHHDGGALGAAVPLGVWERRLTELKKLGVNAIRTAHNPPAPEFLDLCDRMGFLVMDEFFDCWTVGKNPYDYHLYFNEWSKTDARDTILRDRNHPSVVLYSVGNEIHDTPKAELAKTILRGLVDVCHEGDPTRPVTQALFRPNVSGDYTNGLADMLDVVGTNYRDNELLAAQRAHPNWKIIGTEQQHNRQTWLYLRDNPSHSGQFLWTGIDYLGESRRWPVVAAGSGLLDRTGTPRPLAFERQSWWSDKPMVYIARRVAVSQNAPTDPGFSPLDQRQVLFSDWTPRDSQPHQENVEIYSNCKEVDLFLNGKSLGSKPMNQDAAPRNWQITYAPGTLKAVGKNEGMVTAEFELQTAGKPAKIVLTSDRGLLTPTWDDVAFMCATVTDENGVVVPDAGNLISFSVNGPGVIAAVDSADNSSHEPFQATSRHAFQGRCFAILKATAIDGRNLITLTASAPGLKSTPLAITVDSAR